MSTSQNRLSPAPARRDALCMCVHGRACSSFAPGHAVHLIQSRLVSATPAEWVDAIVVASNPVDGAVRLHTLDGRELTVWNGAGAAALLHTGDPVAVHERYHALSAGGRLFNVVAV